MSQLNETCICIGYVRDTLERPLYFYRLNVKVKYVVTYARMYVHTYAYFETDDDLILLWSIRWHLCRVWMCAVWTRWYRISSSSTDAISFDTSPMCCFFFIFFGFQLDFWIVFTLQFNTYQIVCLFTLRQMCANERIHRATTQCGAIDRPIVDLVRSLHTLWQSNSRYAPVKSKRCLCNYDHHLWICLWREFCIEKVMLDGENYESSL